MLASKQRSKGHKKELSGRRVEIAIYSGSVSDLFQSHLGHYRPGSINQGEMEKRAIGSKGQNYDFLGICVGPVQKPSRPISAGKHKPRRCAKTALGPKGQHYEFLGICVGPAQKPSWPISAGKHKPREMEKSACQPIGKKQPSMGAIHGPLGTTKCTPKVSIQGE